MIIYHVVFLLTDQDKLEIDVEVNLTLVDENDKKQKWDLVTDKKTGWMKIKKPNGFFLEASENGNNLFIQGSYLLKVICVQCKRPENIKGNLYSLQFFQKNERKFCPSIKKRNE